MYQTASQAVHRAATFCDRNAQVCESAETYWGVFKEKAAVGARMLGDLVNERLKATSAPENGSPSPAKSLTPVLERSVLPRETLRPTDRAPEWSTRSRTQL